MTPEERKIRLKKADSIRRMLADSSSAGATSMEDPEDGTGGGGAKNNKKEREQLLALNQVIAQQVMEKSRIVAGN